MIEFIEKDPRLTNTQSLNITYPRTINVAFGNYPVVEDIHNLIISIKNNIDPDISYATNVRANMTKFKFLNDNLIIKRFLDFCVAKHQLTSPGIFEYFYSRKKVEDCWGNELNKGDEVVMHNHEKIHGILYLSGGTPTIFPELNIKIDPSPGDYYFFPPSILHYVEKQISDEKRYTVIFNISENTSWHEDKKIREKYGKNV